MAAPAYTDDDYASALAALLPRGRAWRAGIGSVIAQVMQLLAPTYTRMGARAAYLLKDAFPVAPVELLPEWEATLGLPDPCAGVAPTLQLRQRQVAARFVGNGGQSKAFFIAFAASLGYAITITEFTGADAHKWQVNATTNEPQPFRFGRDRVGERFATWGNAVLECELNRLKPAHTTIIFSYT